MPMPPLFNSFLYHALKKQKGTRPYMDETPLIIVLRPTKTQGRLLLR